MKASQVNECLDRTYSASGFSISRFLFFLFSFCTRLGDNFYCYGYCLCTVYEQQPHNLTFQPFFSISVGPVHCSRDSQTSFFSNFFIKNESHDTIYTFKIILLQCFQFSILSFSKINHIQTDLKCHKTSKVINILFENAN